MAEFHFDFDAVEGMDYAEGLKTLLLQWETHYNATPASRLKLTFGGKDLKIAPKADGPKAERPAVKTDTETITPKTIPMKKFAVRDSADGEGKLLVGEAVDGRQINDLLLPGYDSPPYGPVVSGENGRYNLNPKAKSED